MNIQEQKEVSNGIYYLDQNDNQIPQSLNLENSSSEVSSQTEGIFSSYKIYQHGREKLHPLPMRQTCQSFDYSNSSSFDFSSNETSSQSPSPNKGGRPFFPISKKRCSSHSLLKISVPCRKNLPIEKPILEKKFSNSYQTLEKIGQGAQGEVKRCKNINNQQEFAVKIVFFKDGEHLLNLAREFFQVKSFFHPNVLRAYDLFIENKKCYIILEYISGFSLSDFLRKNRRMNEEQAKFVVAEILKAVQYLHHKGICHRDITCDNILVDEKKNIIKIIDFSNSKSYDFAQHMMTKTGTLSYMAPEIFSDHEYDIKIDTWSIGIVLFYLLSGTLPFINESEPGLISSIQQQELDISSKNPILLHCSKNSLEFLSGLLQKNPKKRFSIKEANCHPWILSANLMYEFQKQPGKMKSVRQTEQRIQSSTHSKLLAISQQNFQSIDNSDLDFNKSIFLNKCLSFKRYGMKGSILESNITLSEGETNSQRDKFVSMTNSIAVEQERFKEEDEEQENQEIQLLQSILPRKENASIFFHQYKKSKEEMIDSSQIYYERELSSISCSISTNLREEKQISSLFTDQRKTKESSNLKGSSPSQRQWQHQINDTNFNDKYEIDPEVLEIEHQSRKRSRSSIFYSPII